MKTKFSLSLLILIFFASGFSSLIYQVAWQRILTLYYSVENISTTLIVSVYMMGLGLGAIVGGYIADRVQKKLELYLCIELLIGLFGCISIPFLEFLGKSTAGSNYLVSFFYMFAFLCFPTFLMGITLPLLTKIFNSIVNNFMHTLSRLYFINTLGASIGTLFSSYVLISFWGLDLSIYFAAAINILIAALIFFYRKRLTSTVTTEQTQALDKTISATPAASLSYRTIYLIVFITGFIAIGYEIIWFRVIGTIVKASPYAFSSILFIFLLGVALGSYFMKKILTRYQQVNKKNLFFIFQFSIAVFILFSIALYYTLVKHVPAFTDINTFSFEEILHPAFKRPNFRSFASIFKAAFRMLDVFIWPLFFAFIPTLFMGASFPLITSLAFRDDKEGDAVGKVYFFNVVGNVTGGLCAGLILLNFIGTEYSLLFLSAMGLPFIFFIRSQRKLFSPIGKGITLAVITALTLLCFPKQHELYDIIHPTHYFSSQDKKTINEGLDGVIVTYTDQQNLKTYINGMSHGGRPIPEFYYEAIEALSFNQPQKKFLVIGFGTGSTVETLLKLQPKPQVELVELNKTLIENLTQVDYLDAYLKDEQLNLVYADGRKYLYNTDEKYDAIFIDPLRTTTSFSNNLYSKQFFDLIVNHLNPGGVFMVWTDEFNVVPKTLCHVFPYVKQYSFFCIASNQPLQQNTAFKTALYEKFPEQHNHLLDIDSKENKTLSEKMILEKNGNFPINEDYRPHCEYYIGLGSMHY
jgi:spermidine synthase